MDTSTDYYHILGVDAQASADTIKSAFKKLALQYHPDIYKGADAQERMRHLLQAYQTLSDPAARKDYDAQRSGKSTMASAPTRREGSTNTSTQQDKRFAFPDLSTTPVTTLAFALDDIAYKLSSAQAETLRWDGVLRGVAADPEGAGSSQVYHCHRCHHKWSVPATSRNPPTSPQTCPACHSSQWAEYLLMRCIHCQAVFESKEMTDPLHGGSLYNPYELFPLCPHCRRSQWCPAENARVDRLRAAADRRRMFLWLGTSACFFLIVVLLALLLH